jgi:hypothetical protein
MVCPAPSDKSSLISLKEEDLLTFSFEYDLARHYGTPRFEELERDLYSKTFFDVLTNEYFHYKPYYGFPKLFPKSHFLEVYEDNANFQKQLNIADDLFVAFFDSAISSLSFSSKNDVREETANKLAVFFLNFIYLIIGKKDKGNVSY